MAPDRTLDPSRKAEPPSGGWSWAEDDLWDVTDPRGAVLPSRRFDWDRIDWTAQARRAGLVALVIGPLLLALFAADRLGSHESIEDTLPGLPSSTAE